MAALLWYNRRGTDVSWEVEEGSEVQERLASDPGYDLVPSDPVPSDSANSSPVHPKSIPTAPDPRAPKTHIVIK